MIRINPGELKDKITIQEYENIEGVYKFSNCRRISGKVERKYKRKNYSKFGIGTDETTEITIRYIKDLDKSKAIVFDGSHYLISEVNDIENRHRYIQLVAIKQKLWLCEAIRRVPGRDEKNRPKQVPKSIYRFQGYLLEKYSGYNDEKISYSTTKRLILMTPKVIELESGDIVEIDSIRYKVELTHLLDDYFNEYEIVVTKDV